MFEQVFAHPMSSHNPPRPAGAVGLAVEWSRDRPRFPTSRRHSTPDPDSRRPHRQSVVRAVPAARLDPCTRDRPPDSQRRGPRRRGRRRGARRVRPHVCLPGSPRRGHRGAGEGTALGDPGPVPRGDLQACDRAGQSPQDRLGVTIDRTPGGRAFPAGAISGMRWREVMIHHVDLDAGYTPAAWPVDFAEHVIHAMTKRGVSATPFASGPVTRTGPGRSETADPRSPGHPQPWPGG